MLDNELLSKISHLIIYAFYLVVAYYIIGKEGRKLVRKSKIFLKKAQLKNKEERLSSQLIDNINKAEELSDFMKKREENENTLLNNKIEEFSLIFKTLSDIMFVIDESGYIVEEIKTSTKLSSVLGKNIFSDFVVPEDEDKLRLAQTRAIVSKKVNYVDVKMKLYGDIEYYSVAISPYNTKKIRSLFVFRNITETKKKEEEIKYKNLLLDSVVNHIPISLFMYTTDDFRIIFSNEEFERRVSLASDFKIDRSIGKTIFEIFPELDGTNPELSNRIKNLNKEVIDKNKTIRSFFINNFKNINKNEYIYVNSVKIPVTIGENKYILNIENDITREEKLKIEYTKQKELIENILENTPIPIIIYDPKNLIIKYANKYYLEYIKHRNLEGIKKIEDLINKPILSIINNDYTEESYNNILELNKKVVDNKKSIESTVKKRDGKYIKLLKSPILSKDGEVDLIITLLSDITNENNYEKCISKLIHTWEAVISSINIINSEHSIDKMLNLVLEILGVSLEVDRSYIFINKDIGDIHYMVHNSEWVSSSTYKEINNPELKCIDYKAVSPNGLLYDYLANGNIINGKIEDLDKNLIDVTLLEKQNISSILILPIISQTGDFYGYIGFDYCHNSKFSNENFDSTKIYVLKIISTLLGFVFSSNFEDGVFKN